jgi:hypothetical protein
MVVHDWCKSINRCRIIIPRVDLLARAVSFGALLVVVVVLRFPTTHSPQRGSASLPTADGHHRHPSSITHWAGVRYCCLLLLAARSIDRSIEWTGRLEQPRAGSGWLLPTTTHTQVSSSALSVTTRAQQAAFPAITRLERRAAASERTNERRFVPLCVCPEGQPIGRIGALYTHISASPTPGHH